MSSDIDPAHSRKPTARKTASRRRSTVRSEEGEKSGGLSKQKVVEAALAQIDEFGLDAFSLRDVARALGVYPTALYWHVRNRSALLAEVVSFAMEGMTPPRGDGSWQDWFRSLFRGYRQVICRHPNLAQLVGAQLLSNAYLDVQLIDQILEVLEVAGVPPQHMLEHYNVIIAAMTGFSTLEFAAVPSEDPDGWRKDLQERVHQIRALENPTLARHLPALANRAFILRWESGRDVPLDSSFEVYVDIVIAGLEARIQRISRGVLPTA